ncbi:MAG: N-acetylmuramoyl-L-alanine amidase CwlD [Clostridiales bacterium]|nr:N-acetylmuramoyl-L-alanine amidase CwlD [Clostridiales bacterium]
MRKRELELAMALIMIIILSMYARNVGDMAVSVMEIKKSQVVVIDPGHGGFDPGKVGVNKALEKDINLSIALNLKELLEQEGILVIMTREEDVGLYKETDSNKKVSDMKKRCEIIDESNCDLAVSIHQNSFSSASISGPQVFYFETSIEGQRLASIIQKQLIDILKPKKERVEKADNNYYMLKKVKTPSVIIECGFLSNAEEAMLLTEGNYQEKIALAIKNGILEYLKK